MVFSVDMHVIGQLGEVEQRHRRADRLFQTTIGVAVECLDQAWQIEPGTGPQHHGDGARRWHESRQKV